MSQIGEQCADLAAPVASAAAAAAAASARPVTVVRILIPSYVATLLRYRLLCDALRALADLHVPSDACVHVHVSYQVRLEPASSLDADERERRRTWQRLAGAAHPRPDLDGRHLDRVPPVEPIDTHVLRRCLPSSLPRVHLHLHEQAPFVEQHSVGSTVAVDVRGDDGDGGSGGRAGTARPMSQFEHLCRLYDRHTGVVADDDVVIFHDDDDVSPPNRVADVLAVWKMHRDVPLVLHGKHRFVSSSTYAPLHVLLASARTDTENDANGPPAGAAATRKRTVDVSAEEWFSDLRLIEFFQYAIRGRVLRRLAASFTAKDRQHGYCDLALGRRMYDVWRREKAPTLLQPLLIQRISVHRRFYTRERVVDAALPPLPTFSPSAAEPHPSPVGRRRKRQRTSYDVDAAPAVVLPVQRQSAANGLRPRVGRVGAHVETVK